MLAFRKPFCYFWFLAATNSYSASLFFLFSEWLATRYHWILAISFPTFSHILDFQQFFDNILSSIIFLLLKTFS